MNAIRLVVMAAAFACAGCTTVIIRPARAPECAVPVELKGACTASAKVGESLTYGDLPGVALSARQDFAECRKSYVAMMQSYEVCVGGLKQFNQSLKKLEEQARSKYKDATWVED